jgi:hypothetical protein
MSLSKLRPSVIDARYHGRKIEYAIRVSNSSDLCSPSTIVYHRYGDFVQLQLLFQSTKGRCCGGYCMLKNCLQEVFDNSNFRQRKLPPQMAMVQGQIYYLNSFFSRLDNALAACPVQLIDLCEWRGCQVSGLLKHFLGSNEPHIDHECTKLGLRYGLHQVS